MFVKLDKLEIDPAYQRPDPLEAIPVQKLDPERDEVLSILRGTRTLLSRPYGWMKRMLSGPASRRVDTIAYCLVGSISVIGTGRVGYLDSDDDTYRASIKAGQAVAEAAGLTSYLDIAEWNDAEKRKKKEVLAVLDKAIMNVEEGI